MSAAKGFTDSFANGRAAGSFAGAEAAGEEPTLFRVRLAPHRSLDQRGFRIVMLIVAAVSLVCGTAFLMMGAWPVFGVFGLDVLAIYIAFRMSFRSARAREEITVTPSLIEVRKIDPRGTADEARMNPLWTRLDKEFHEDYGLQRLSLTSRGAPVVVGGFLHTQQREELAQGLDRALAQAKRGVVRSQP
ncbi:DUF2244 domain-containing protein [Ancylobacter defluvii]|uniref:Membrane protein n=1 Tax=Ancylobacter defluvii TaxID=1282440 RepID=A0A9W6JX02_9HYPH|nr:DUF2244 domain-containing protein [Ancylobacter defluvii]MBS7590527.1 DUF2244 domain-containing protein [Ancylobacter defluvii]GLK83449.1 membrane protein [Ancylobacter defluvii]